MFHEKCSRAWRGGLPACDVSSRITRDGLGESLVDSRIQPVYKRYKDEHNRAGSPGEVQVHLRMWTEDAALAKKSLRKSTGI